MWDNVLAGSGGRLGVLRQVPVGQVVQERLLQNLALGGRFVVGCRSCGASPAQPGVPGALRVLWEGQGGFLTSQIGNCQK